MEGKIVRKGIIFIVSFIISLGIFAHSGPKDSRKKIEGKTAQKMASMEIKRLVKERKIGLSWLSATYLKSVEKKFGSEKEWVVIFKNGKIKNNKKKKLYVFLSSFGDFLAANYTGD
jgi:hypothetical protein